MSANTLWHSLRNTAPPSEVLVLVAAVTPSGWAFNIVAYDSENDCWLDHSAGTEDVIEGIDGYDFWQIITPPAVRPSLNLVRGDAA